MAPVQVYHICDVCGKRTLRETESMRPMRVIYDGHDELWRKDLVCQECRDEAMAALTSVLAGRKAKC